MKHCDNDSAAPPPYTGVLQDWQKRWNREWLKNAELPETYRKLDFIKRTQHREGAGNIPKDRATTEKIFLESSIDRWETYLPEADRKGKRGLFRSALHRIILLLHLDNLKTEYRDFKRWRQEKREAASNVIVEVDMEDEGNGPRWKGKMIFKMDPKLCAQYMDTDTWFAFPTPDNTRWFWITEPKSNERSLHGMANGRWGPASNTNFSMPFRNIHGTVHRHARQGRGCGKWCGCRLREDF